MTNDLTGVNLHDLLALPDSELRPALESMLPADAPIPGRRDMLEIVDDYAGAPEGTVAVADGKLVIWKTPRGWTDGVIFTENLDTRTPRTIIRWGKNPVTPDGTPVRVNE